MNRLNELIQRLCPDGVELKRLGDQQVCVMQRGTVITKNSIIMGEIPVIAGGKNPAYYCNQANRTGETITIAGSGAYAGFISYWNIPIFVSDAFSIKGTELCSTKYLYYLLLNMQDKIYATKKGAGIPHVHIKDVENFKISIPPLDVQNEIVRILDTFTSHAAELQARKEQYEYYRNKLLTFDKDDKNVKWMKLGEIGTFIRGKRFVRTDIVENGIPCIHYGDMYTYYGLKATKTKGMLRKDLAAKMRFAQKNDVVIVAAGENKDDIGVGLAWLGEEPVAVHDACFIFKSKMYPQYVAHFLRTDYYHKQIKKYVSEAKICSISAKGLAKTIIPVPSFEKQQHISSILDKFEALVNDLTEGLPAEIAAVQEQYEYYRNKLLTFKDVGTYHGASST